MSPTATTTADQRLRLHGSAVVEDRDTEVVVFLADSGGGSVLRGVPALMFRSLYARFGTDAFTADTAAQDGSAGGAEQWLSTLGAMVERNILVSAAAPRGSTAAPKLLRVLSRMGSADTERLGELLCPHTNVEVVEEESWTGEGAPGDQLAVRLDLLLDVSGDLVFAREQTAAGRPSLLARVYGASVELGPWTIPRRTPCFECYWLRLQSGRETAVPQSLLRPVLSEPKRSGRTLEVESALILLAGEIGKAATGSPPVSLGQVVRQDLRTLETVKHKVVRVPTCATCATAGRERS
jgi:bacteriocin biosynthesis cyclodehydratase domain-containing protein